MINSYPAWKYLMIFFVLILGFIYALPNLYKENFAVSIVKNISNIENFDDMLVTNITKVLKQEKVNIKSIFLKEDIIKICFFSESDQLHAYKLLSSFFSEKCFVSCIKLLNMPHWLCFIRAKPLKLGLDLKGGIHLVVRVDIRNMLVKLQEQYINVLQSGLYKTNIPYMEICKKNLYDITIIFQNVDYRNKAIPYLSKMYTDLVFNVINDVEICAAFSERYIHTIYEYAIKQNSIILRNRINQLKIYDPLIYRYGSDYIIIEIPKSQDISNVKKALNNTASLEFRLVNMKLNQFNIVNNSIPENSEIKLDNSGNIVPLYKKIILTGDHIINSSVTFDEYHLPIINIFLDNLGSNIMSKFTKDNIGKLIATLFIEYKDTGKKDAQGYPILCRYDKVINVATIQSPLTYNFCITGIKDLNEARYLSSLLRMGALASPIYIEEERIIGSMLGKKNIQQGIIACIVGLLILICFMIGWYRYFGLISGIALISNLVLMTSLISMIPGIVLTMSSIAGIILTLSVAIDANVLINERIKEELRQGKPVQYAIYVGYRKAFTSIIDANVTTIITAMILCIFNEGTTIQGFAVTTLIGVGTSIFTSIAVTRAFVNLIYGKKCIGKLSI